MGRPSLGTRKQVNVRFPPALIEEIDAARGPVSRDQWMERAARLALRPAATAVDPSLRVRQAHQHDFNRLAGTSFKQGRRLRTYACICGQKIEREV